MVDLAQAVGLTYYINHRPHRRLDAAKPMTNRFPVPVDRLVPAFLAFPLPAALMATVSGGASLLFSGSLEEWLFVVLVFCVSYICVVAVGIPLCLLFNRFALLSWHYGAIGGALVALPLVAGSFPSEWVQLEVLVVDLGMAGGWLFWFIALRNGVAPRVHGIRLTVGRLGVALLLVVNLVVYVPWH